MKKTILLFLLMLLPSVIAYPNQEIPAVYQEVCPNAMIGKDLVFQDDGNGIYLRYISPLCSIPNATEAERLWETVQEKRVLEAQNQTIANRIKQNYTQAMADLNTIQNANPPFTSAGFNQVVWAQKREAAILQDILRFLKWIFFKSE